MVNFMQKLKFQKVILNRLNYKLHLMSNNAIEHIYLTNILFIESGLELDYFMD